MSMMMTMHDNMLSSFILHEKQDIITKPNSLLQGVVTVNHAIHWFDLWNAVSGCRWSMVHCPLQTTPWLEILTGIVRVPSLISSILSWGWESSTVQPTDCAVPRISFTVPDRLRAMERCLIVRAISITWSMVILPLCLTTMKELVVKFNMPIRFQHPGCDTLSLKQGTSL